MQVCTSLQTDNHASTSLLEFFYRPDALPAAQPTVSKHWRKYDNWIILQYYNIRYDSIYRAITVVVPTSAANLHGTNTLISQQRKHLRPLTSSEETSRAAQPISVSSVTKHLWDLSWSTHYHYVTTLSNATSTKSNRTNMLYRNTFIIMTDMSLIV